MKLIVSSLVALAMAAGPVAAAYLRTAQAQTNLVDSSLGVEEGEVYIEMDTVDGDGDLSPLCRIALMDAFNDAYDQVYSINGMTVVIESEEPIPADVENLLAPRGGYLWKTYYVSRPDSLELCFTMECQYALSTHSIVFNLSNCSVAAFATLTTAILQPCS